MDQVIKRVILGTLKLGALCLVCFFVGPCSSGERSFCSVCGMEAHRELIRFGVTPLKLELSAKLTTNAMAQALGRDHSLDGHAHQWLFASGGSIGVCAIGRGRHLARPVGNTNVAAFITQLIEAGSRTNLDTWRHRLLDPKQADDACFAIFAGWYDQEERGPWQDVAEQEFSKLMANRKPR